MSIRAKVLMAIIGAVILSIVGITGMVSKELDKAFVNDFKVSSKAQLDRMNAFVDNFFENAFASAAFLAASPLVEENIGALTSYAETTTPPKTRSDDLPPRERALYEELLRLHKAFPTYEMVYVGDSKGGMTSGPSVSLPAGFNPSKRPWYQDTIAAGKTFLTAAYISAAGGAVCTVATPVPAAASKGITATVALDISLDTLTKETGNVSVGATGYVLMLDALGHVISDPRNSAASTPEERRWLGKTVDKLPDGADKALGRLRTLRQGETEVEFQGKTWLAAVQTTEADWVLIMVQEKAEIFADAMRVSLSILLIGGIITVLMLIVAWVVARSIAGPVAVLAGASRAVAEGDLQAIPQDERPFRGELGVLHKSLRQMVAKLTELIQTANNKIREAEEALSQSRRSLNEAEEAKKMAEQARHEGELQAAGQIGTVIDQLAVATKRLAAEAEQTGRRSAEQQTRMAEAVTAIGQMNDAVSDVAASTSRTALLAEEARAEARKGGALVQEVVNSMGEIQNQSLAMRANLSSLGAQATDIGQIMGVINDIADQTNLLALNAAIEAARAGEAGRGFAVVADEVRKLAEKTVEATKQVGQAIRTIQQGTNENQEAMQKAADYITASAEIARNAGSALAGIEKRVDRTAGEVRAIATASEEQSVTITEINRNTEGVDSLTREVAEGARHTNEMVREFMELSGRLGAIVESLRKGAR